MASPVTLQTLQKAYPSSQEVAYRYYRTLAGLNDLDLTHLELRLLAHTAVRGNISSHTSRAAFMEAEKTSKATIANLVSSLYKKGFLQKEDGRTFVHPGLQLNFTRDLVLNLKLLHDPA